MSNNSHAEQGRRSTAADALDDARPVWWNESFQAAMRVIRYHATALDSKAERVQQRPVEPLAGR